MASLKQYSGISNLFIPLEKEDQLLFYLISDQMHAIHYLSPNNIREQFDPLKDNDRRVIHFEIVEGEQPYVLPWYDDYKDGELEHRFRPELSYLPGFFLANFGDYPSDDFKLSIKKEILNSLKFIKEHYLPKISHETVISAKYELISIENNQAKCTINTEELPIDTFVEDIEDIIHNYETPTEVFKGLVNARNALFLQALRFREEKKYVPYVTNTKISSLYMMMYHAFQSLYDEPQDAEQKIFSNTTNIGRLCKAQEENKTEAELIIN